MSNTHTFRSFFNSINTATGKSQHFKLIKCVVNQKRTWSYDEKHNLPLFSEIVSLCWMLLIGILSSLLLVITLNCRELRYNMKEHGMNRGSIGPHSCGMGLNSKYTTLLILSELKWRCLNQIQWILSKVDPILGNPLIRTTNFAICMANSHNIFRGNTYSDVHAMDSGWIYTLNGFKWHIFH